MIPMKPILIIDFDLTLIKHDLFVLNLKKLILTDFCSLLKIQLKSRSWIEFKLGILFLNNYTFEEIVNNDLLVHINKIGDNFESIVVVSATPQIFLRNFIPEGYFDGLYGSTTINLKGVKKLRFIQNKFGNNFGYIGDSKSDEIIFETSIYADKIIDNKIINLKNEIF